jgi:hypothetical protein
MTGASSFRGSPDFLIWNNWYLHLPIAFERVIWLAFTWNSSSFSRLSLLPLLGYWVELIESIQEIFLVI